MLKLSKQLYLKKIVRYFKKIYSIMSLIDCLVIVLFTITITLLHEAMI